MPRTESMPGLSSDEARRRLTQHGPNAVTEQRARPWRAYLGKFWAPIPWMLEVAVVLQLALGKYDEAAVIAFLLVFNATLSFLQEHRANRALALLKSRLAVRARVLRDGRWQLLPAQELVPGDVVHLRMGDLAPADIHLHEGQVLLDQSTLTGESMPVDAAVGATAYAGTTVQRGEATGEVSATGARTAFGKTAELVRIAKTASHLERTILGVVKYLVALDVALVCALLVYAALMHIPWAHIVPFAVILLVASIPVALPATFTLATALGAQELARHGVLVTRLSAIEEAAAMDMLATDKTGTLTENRLTLAALQPYPGCREDELLRYAALACDEATQDPIDLAILTAARARNLDLSAWQRVRFIPFDPQTKRAEAVLQHAGDNMRVIKGAPRVITDLVRAAPGIDADLERLAAQGYRVLAVAAGTDADLRLCGLIALHDPPRADSQALIRDLRDLGIRVMMITGDGQATARAVAAQVGLGDRVCLPETLRTANPQTAQACDVFARVLPEDKFHLVQILQRAGHVTGMTGDGVNDAPALKQAEVGIAVANATDVAKAAASMTLTNPGLGDMLAAVRTSRCIYQRMLTYTLNMSIKKFVVAFFLSLGLLLTGTFVATPLLIVLWMISNDFITMSIATDRVSYSHAPDRWRIAPLLATAAVLSVPVLLLAFAVFFAARDVLHLPLPQVQTLIFVLLVFVGQGVVYLVRERAHFWRSRPSRWLMASTFVDIGMASLLATQGLLMAAVAPLLIAELLGVVAVFLVALDYAKVRVFRRFALR